MSVELVARAALALIPVLLFLLALQLMDSYKLVRRRQILAAITAGAAAAALSWLINTLAFSLAGAHEDAWAAFGAPVIEELAKAVFVIYLVAWARVAFMVDAGICGFAVGAGFAVVENVSYLHLLSTESLAVALVRGLGTAVMHGGVTALAAILAVYLLERKGWRRLRLFAPGLLLAIAIHTFFNLGLLPPVAATVAMLTGLPLILSAVYMWSERGLQRWLGEKLDQDIELLDSIATGTLLQTRAGAYLHSLQNAFAPEIRGDMLCMLQLTIELSLRAKGDLLRRESGIEVSPDPELEDRFRELAYLERSIGPTGMRAVKPLLSQTSRDLWELHGLWQRRSGVAQKTP